MSRPAECLRMVPVLAYIPSPRHGIVHIGPLPLHAYGLMLAIGVLAAVAIAERRAGARGFPEGIIGQVATAVVVAGVIGARLYHLFTGYDWSRDGLVGTVEIWKGGLSIWGAVGGGVLALVLIARKRKLDTLLLLDAVGPAVAVAQAIGRWGNYFNQELFGRPTTLPWAVKIDLAHRPAGYTQYATFHPTFLYESLWCLAIFVIIIGVERRRGLRRGQAFALYGALYTFERFWMELLRVDKATRLFGMRFNALVSIALCVVSIIWFIRLGRRPVLDTADPTLLELAESGDGGSAASTTDGLDPSA
jgi:prolipoprotein diacylglyceryl transferase